MKKQLLLATNNPSKTREIAESLKNLNLEILSLANLKRKNYPPEPPEDGETFKKNAQIKSEFWHQKTGLLTLADDSGILVNALPNELGVRTVRFGAGAKASDEKWLEYFLARMKGVKNRHAKFVCMLALSRTNEPTEFFRGEVEGEILEKIAAPILPRIPLSSVFLANGASKVFAAMTESEKEKFSHRGKAIAKAKQKLRELLK